MLPEPDFEHTCLFCLIEVALRDGEGQALVCRQGPAAECEEWPSTLIFGQLASFPTFQAVIFASLIPLAGFE